MAEHRRKKKPLIFRILKKLFNIGIFILVVLVITYFVSAFVCQRIVVHNVSMQDTLTEGDILIMDKLTYKIRDPKRYEIICFNSAHEREGLIKRVIGLPGERVQITDGMIFINGNKIEDVEGLSKIENPGRANVDVLLLDDEFFVIGDNRAESIDSRSEEIGNVIREDIMGKAMLRIYPFSKFGKVK